MKIGYFMDTYLPTVTGISYSLEKTIKELYSRGHELHIISPAPESDTPGFKHLAPSFSVPFRVQRLGFISHSSIEELDLVHVHQPYTIGLTGLLKALNEKSPLLYTYHTDHSTIFRRNISSPLLGNLVSNLFSKWEEIFLRKSDKIIAPTSIIKKENLRKFKGKTEVIPNPIDTDLFFERNKEKLNIDLDLNKKIIGYAGRISREKNIEALIKIAGSFEGNIVIVGEGEAKDYYKRKAEPHDNIKFFDYFDRGKLPYLLSALDFFVLPSTSETQGLTAIEANACGTPVLGADRKALKEVIVEGFNGYLFDPYRSESLIEALKRGYKNIRELSKSSKKIAEKYNPEETTDKLLKLYRSVIN